MNPKYKNLLTALKSIGWHSNEDGPYLEKESNPEAILLESITHEIAHLVSTGNDISPMNEFAVAQLIKKLDGVKAQDYNEFLASSITQAVLGRLGVLDEKTLKLINDNLHMNIVDQGLFHDKTGKIESIFNSMIDCPDVIHYADKVLNYYDGVLNDER